jgi:hypothetical protein
MRILVLVSVCCVAVMSTPALANVDAYCEAYAIDFANGAETNDTLWQQRRDDARAACLLQYKDVPVVAKAKPKRVKPVTVTKKVEMKAEPETQAKAKTEAPVPKLKKLASKEAEPDVQPASVAKKPNIKEGTAAWYDYCARKYSSFSRKTGKYMSKTGVERKCLVTADFQ